VTQCGSLVTQCRSLLTHCRTATLFKCSECAILSLHKTLSTLISGMRHFHFKLGYLISTPGKLLHAAKVRRECVAHLVWHIRSLCVERVWHIHSLCAERVWRIRCGTFSLSAHRECGIFTFSAQRDCGTFALYHPRY